MSNGIAAHGTKIERQATPGGAFTTIGEVKNITAPELSRNEIETSSHNDDIDSFVMGILRRSLLTFDINWISKDAQHDETTGLMKHLIDNTKTGYRITFPDTDVVIFSGYVKAIGKPAEVEGALTSPISIRPSGPMKYNTVSIGG